MATLVKIYRTSYSTGDGHQGYGYHSSLKNAKDEFRTLKDSLEDHEKHYILSSWTIDIINVRLTKSGVIDALNKYGGHNDNG